jgi:LuxR family transcriptional regulator, maltose regulon positive regulatory protein
MSSLKSSSLLHTKLMPPRLPASVVSRERLLARLDSGLTKKVSLVTAPTGFGKTTLVRLWIASREVPSAWVTLDEHDNDPVRFWTYVCSALRTLDPSLGKASLSMLMSPQPPSFESLLTPLINDLAQLRVPCVLVLEDYHSIKSNDIEEGVTFLIQQLPESIHLVFVTRTTPKLPLGLLRARDELIEIEVMDLRFNQQEAESFLQTVAQKNLPSSAVARLLQKTEGWPAALRLGARALQNKEDTAQIENWIDSFSGSDRYIAEYLIKEVFESQSLETQAFLMRTSFFPRLTSSLCDAILESTHSAARLEQLERDNLFIVQLERGENQIWYRYSPLFAEALQHFARGHLDEAEIQVLFEKAANWYEYHNLVDEAVETALAAKLFDRAMSFIEVFIEIHDLSEMQTIRRWLEHIPPQEIFRHPVTCFTYAQVLLYSSDRFASATAVHIEPFLRAAESTWRMEENQARLGQLLSFRGNVVWWQGDFQKAFDYAYQALDLLPEHDVFWRGNSLLSVSYEALSAGRILEAQDKSLEARALLGAAQNIYGVLAANQFLAEIFYEQGQLEQAEQLNQQIQREAVGHESMLDDQGTASLNLAHIAYERNELDLAEVFAKQSLHLAGQRANEMLEVQVASRLAQILSAKGDSSGAHDLLKSLEARIHNPPLLREIQAAQALALIRANDISSLDWWLKKISDENRSALPVQKEREALTLARLRIAEGMGEEALSLLTPWHEDAVQNGRVRSQVEALSLQALAYHADANLTEATQSLEEALTLGQAKGFRRIFLDEGRRMAALLQASLPKLSNRTLSLFAATLLQSFSPEVTSNLAATDLANPIEPLSQQEVRVLRLLVTGLSNTDIARELVVSTNTIKTHVKSIYRKLNVNSRKEARQVARELRLV